MSEIEKNSEKSGEKHSDLEEYVRKYAKQNNISIEEAKKHAIVQSVKDYHENRDKMSYSCW